MVKSDLPDDNDDLKQNDLATWLQYGLPIFLRKNGSYLLLGLALCLLGYQLYNRYEQKKQVEVQTAWNELDAAGAPSADNAPNKLESLIAQYQIKPIQAMAYLQIANFYLEDVAHGNPPTGFRGVKISRDDALAKAESAAKTVVSNFSDQTLAVGKAHLALAAVALDRGDFDAARKQYELLTDKSGPFADSAFAQLADAQLKNLDAYQKVPPLAALAPPEPPPAPPATFPSGTGGFPGMSNMPSPTGLTFPENHPIHPPSPGAPNAQP
ncbi:MAG: hypothetical protein ACTHN5_15765 [Phycisphaerae bacterium]